MKWINFIFYNFRNLEYCLNKAEFVSKNIKTTINKNGEFRDSEKITANTTSSNGKTTGKKIKLTDKNQQSNDDKKLKAEERTNTPNKAHEYISETVKKLDQILIYIEEEFNKLDHQERYNYHLSFKLNLWQQFIYYIRTFVDNYIIVVVPTNTSRNTKKLNVIYFY